MIAHDSRQVRTLARELAERDVPTSGARESRAFAESPVARALLSFVDHAGRDRGERTGEDAEEILTAAGLDPVELRRLRSALRLAEQPDAPALTGPMLLASALDHPIEFDLLDTREARRAARIAGALATITGLLGMDGTVGTDGTDTERAAPTAHELLWAAWEGTGRAAELTAAVGVSGAVGERARDDLNDVVDLFQAAKRHGERDDGTTALQFIRATLDSTLAEDRLTAPVRDDVVRVVTPASALGIDVDTVVVAGLQDGVWPNLRSRGSLMQTRLLADPRAAHVIDGRRDVLNDELRLFVRAVSRAHRRTILTAVDDDDVTPSVLMEFGPDAQPAPASAEHPLSLRGLVARHRRTLTSVDSSRVEREHAAAQLALLAGEGVVGASPDEWYGIAELTSVGGIIPPGPARISPSRLQSIETCPLDWVIGELASGGTAVSAGVGTLVHAALETEHTDEESLWRVVEDRWGELVFDSEWRERATRADARELVRRLAAYLRHIERAGGRVISAEPQFEVVLEDAEIPGGAIVRGVMDRIEESSDGGIVIADLKTGKSDKTNAKVAANAQLAAYQLAFERGALPELSGRDLLGAKLVVLKTDSQKDFVEPFQDRFSDEARAEFLERLRHAVATMREETFDAPFERHCRDDHTYGQCRIHTIGPVSAS